MQTNPLNLKALLRLGACCAVFVGTAWQPAWADAQDEPDQATAPVQEAARDWPRWRGRNFDGASHEADWSHQWGESGPPLIWERSIGVGFSSFSISDGCLYTMGSVQRDPQQRNRKPQVAQRDDVIWRLDAATGDVVWTHRYAAALIARLHEGGPSATPTLDGDRGYTVSKQGHFVCFHVGTGESLWTHELTDLLDVKMPNWGFAGSPLVVDNLVIYEAGRTVAFDRLTGKVVWRTEKFKPAYSSPVSFPDPKTEKRLVASLNNEVLLVLDATTGAEVARAPFVTSHPTNACTPIVRGDTIFLSSGYNRGCELWRLTGEGLQWVYGNRNMRNHMNSCVFFEGFLYGIDGNSHSRRTATLRCIDHATGDLQWKQRGYGVGSVLLAGGRFLVLSDEGELLVVKPNPDKFVLLASAKVIEGKCWTPPVLCAGRLYIRNAEGRLICLDMRR